jgi:serine/threonine protein kinase/tetratricopeptide (TPR) repeat protein
MKRSFEKGKLKIHNLLPSIERTFLPIGSTIGKYRILEEIDRGGMAVVYKALQLDLDREVALKVLPANVTINRMFVERFLSEAHAVAKLTHPNIVNIHEVAVENNVYYLAMDYIAGVNLYYHLNYQKPKLIEVLEITAKLADALAYAHKQKIVHRDLKLNNVIMKDHITPVLIDFGLAKALESEEGTITKTGEIMGSPAYMAPERLFGKNADARSDICSLGIMLYEMLTFKNPYLDPRSIHQTTLNVIEANPIPPRKLVMWLPPEIEAITLKAMHKEPEHRYQTMEEFAEDIRRYQRGDVVLANPPSIWTKVKHYIKRHWQFLVICLLTTAFSAVYALGLYTQSRKEKPYWQLIYQMHFKSAPLGKEWYQFPEPSYKNESAWSVKSSELWSPPDGYSFIRFNRAITRDAKVEFDIRGTGDNFFNVGFFLYGSCPDSGYGFHIYRGPNAECGITYPGSSHLFSDYNPLALAPSRRFHVAIERKENVISFKLNDMVIAKICDFFPPLGPQHQSMGFFVNGAACAIDNMKVFRYAIPMMPSPTLVADRFAERGDCRTAIDEYKELLVDFSNTQLSHDILLRIAECNIRLGQYDKAQEILSDPELNRRDEAHLKCLFLQGVMQERKGIFSSADSAYLTLGAGAAASLLFQSALSRMVLENLERIGRGEAGAAESKVVFMTQSFPRYSRLLGKLHCGIMEYYTDEGMPDAALEVGQTIVRLHGSDNEVLSSAKVNLGALYLAKHKKGMAVDVLNQCIASYVASEGVWRAWMELAALYENDANYADAYMTYKKVYEDCPRSLVIPWLARLKMGQIAELASSEESPKRIFDEVVKSPHPFVLPRTIARFYRGMISENEFKKFWDSMYPNDVMYLHYLIIRALLNHDKAAAQLNLDYLDEVSPPSAALSMQLQNLHGFAKRAR